MPRRAVAYLADILESCDGIALALRGVDLADYLEDRVVRKAVEREFMIIGEAVNTLSRLDPKLAAGISHARKVVDFRNQLAHAYASIEDETVWAISVRDVPILRSEVAALLTSHGGTD